MKPAALKKDFAEPETDELVFAIDCLNTLKQESHSVNKIALLHLNAPTINKDLLKMSEAFEKWTLSEKLKSDIWSFTLGMIAGFRAAVKSIICDDGTIRDEIIEVIRSTRKRSGNNITESELKECARISCGNEET